MSATTAFDRPDDPGDHLRDLGDPRRMRVLASIDFDDPRLRDELDAVTARTADRLGLPISLVTLVLDSAQLFAGSHGVAGWVAEAGGTPVEWSFCAHTVAARAPYIVTDAVTDPIHAHNPLVAIDGLASYAGVPLVVDGQVLGGHCVVGGTARTFTDADMSELRAAAADVVTLLERHRIAPH